MKKIVAVLALMGGIMLADAAVVTAEAQIIVPGPGVVVAPGAYGYRRHHRHWRRDCYTERRRVRVMTDYGPRWRWRRVRVCD